MSFTSQLRAAMYPAPSGAVGGPRSVVASAVQAFIREMSAEGLVCDHQPECPSAQAQDCQAARVRVVHPEAGWSLLCNGVIQFDDTGCLRPDGLVAEPPQRPLPSAGYAWQAVGA